MMQKQTVVFDFNAIPKSNAYQGQPTPKHLNKKVSILNSGGL